MTDPARLDHPDNFKYWAFISYSHADEVWAKWLHRTLETYRVPSALVGRPSRNGAVPRRIFPLFRDREELPTSASLSDNIGDALARSRYLIVICSARAAVSRWVNEEVKAFKALGRSDRILCLIVDGEPNASDDPHSGQLECFPVAVRHDVSPAGEILDSRTEPIAADVRAGKDGKSNARLKLLAGILGVNFDALRQRERRRRIWRRIMIGIGASAVAALIGAVWYRGHLEARQIQRAQDLRLAQLMIQKTKDALAHGDDASAMFYGANAIEYSLLAGVRPLESDLLQSLTLSAFTQGRVNDAKFSGGLAVSPDGKRMVWGRKDGTLVLWDIAAKRLLRVFAGHKGPVSAAAFTPDGAWLATAGSDGTVRIWSVAGKGVYQLAAKAPAVRSLAVSRDGTLLAAAGADWKIHLWSIARRQELRALTGHSDQINSIAFSPDDIHLASASQDRQIALWKLASGRMEKRFRYRIVPRAVAFSSTGELAASLFDGTIRLWDTARWRETGVLQGHFRMVDTLAFSPDGQILASGSDDWTVALWDVSARQKITTLSEHSRPIKAVAFAGNGATLVAGSEDETISLWHIVPQLYVSSFEAHEGAVRSLAFSPGGQALVSAGEDGMIRVWDVETHRQLYEFPHLHDDAVYAVAFTPGGRYLLSAGRDHRIVVWDWATKRKVRTVIGHSAWIFGLAISPDGKTVATAGWDDKVKVWSVPQLRPLAPPLAEHTAPVGGVAFSPDGRLLASAGNDTKIWLWDARTFKPIAPLTGHTEVVRPVVFDPDSRLLASGSGDHHIKLWDVSPPRRDLVLRKNPLATLEGHHSYMIWALAFSPDGRLLASGSQSDDRQTVRLWDVRRRRLVARLPGHRDYALALAFSPDGKRLASGGSDGTIRFWRTSDFWPAPKTRSVTGALLQEFLDSPPYRSDLAEALLRKIGTITGLELVGTDAQPIEHSAGE